ncbi:putative nitrile hydratase regulator 1 [Rhodococcus erythropolis PR4]|uniref:Putative nitrile hydratase regulator 1 n=1 Tax=Rhodococcus erythropolis (strain PR4 / NBRC 100887) TaxID=234621 RepID=C0ZVD6_RHOE4|nr:putative nitrile hydratase regulator 1 [Rhodococcus erythropolis PR4]
MPTESGRHSATFNPQPASTTSKSDTAQARTNSCLRSVPCRRQRTKRSSLTHAQSNERRRAIRKQYSGSLSQRRKARRTPAFHCIGRF